MELKTCGKQMVTKGKQNPRPQTGDKKKKRFEKLGVEILFGEGKAGQAWDTNIILLWMLD